MCLFKASKYEVGLDVSRQYICTELKQTYEKTYTPIRYNYYTLKLMIKKKSLKASESLLKFWEVQISKSQHASNYFFRKTPSHYHMMLVVMTAYYKQQNLTVEELKTKLFKTSRPKSSSMINEACKEGFFYLEKESLDKRRKYIRPTIKFIKEYDTYLNSINKACI